LKTETEMALHAPFPYFGGKRKVAGRVWQALGNPKHYIEPFFGSGAVLLLRPDFEPQMTETVCDKDGFVANVWRALQADPDEVAKWCDWPVNHADLNARRKVLIANEDRLLDSLCADDGWYDAKMAGYWIWAASCWIGSGLTRKTAIPNISGGGSCVHAKGAIPHIGTGGRGVHAKGKIPHISNGGRGVHAVGNRDNNSGDFVLGEPYNMNIYDWFRRLSERLRYVRVVCGDWTRVCGGNWQDKMGIVGMFFDPPYGVIDRDTSVYHHDSTTVAHDVMEWVKARGDNPRYRIVLAGYEEYAPLLEHGWTAESWMAQGGYSNSGANNNENRHREMLYFSPHTLKPSDSCASDNVRAVQDALSV
jgi:site-specific DNA-adenine methylase